MVTIFFEIFKIEVVFLTNTKNFFRKYKELVIVILFKFDNWPTIVRHVKNQIIDNALKCLIDVNKNMIVAENM